jgi:hypothetical protein
MRLLEIGEPATFMVQNIVKVRIPRKVIRTATVSCSSLGLKISLQKDGN